MKLTNDQMVLLLNLLQDWNNTDMCLGDFIKQLGEIIK